MRKLGRWFERLRFWYWTFVESCTCHGAGPGCLWLKKTVGIFDAISFLTSASEKIAWPPKKGGCNKIGESHFWSVEFWEKRSNSCDWKKCLELGGCIFFVPIIGGIWIHKNDDWVATIDYHYCFFLLSVFFVVVVVVVVAVVAVVVVVVVVVVEVIFLLSSQVCVISEL